MPLQPCSYGLCTEGSIKIYYIVWQNAPPSPCSYGLCTEGSIKIYYIVWQNAPPTMQLWIMYQREYKNLLYSLAKCPSNHAAMDYVPKGV